MKAEAMPCVATVTTSASSIRLGDDVVQTWIRIFIALLGHYYNRDICPVKWIAEVY